MQHFVNKFTNFSKTRPSSPPLENKPKRNNDAPMDRGDTLALLTSIKNNIGNFRKLTHLEITYIEEMLNLQELIELIKVYDDCITLIVDSNPKEVMRSYRVKNISGKSLHFTEQNSHVDEMIHKEDSIMPIAPKKVIDSNGRLRIQKAKYSMISALYN
jgi:hypothetical protein